MPKIHFLEILEISEIDSFGNVIWKEDHLLNIFHQQGEEFILKGMFNIASGIEPPTNYYLGLDARLVLADTDTLSALIAEPTTNGYSRQPVSSLNGFTVSLGTNNKFRAVSGAVVFSASGGSWGPVRNVFLTNVGTGTSGYLISSVPLTTPRTVTNGNSISLTISVSLGNCS